MMYLAPVGYDNCAHWVERSAACWVGRVRIPCGIALAQQKAPKCAALCDSGFPARIRAIESRNLAVVSSFSDLGTDGGVKAPGVHFTV